ncbi:Uncharacterised protein [Vibrio cholerae]|nr:Uncharacterised protein [Vibrio cholerae]
MLTLACACGCHSVMAWVSGDIFSFGSQVVSSSMSNWVR